MKTFKQFCEQAYQLDEVAATATAQNPLAGIRRKVSSAIKPIISNPIVKPIVKGAVGALNVYYNRALGAEKLTTDDPKVGPIERGLGGISAISPPGVSQATGFAHNIIGSSSTLQKVDRKMGKEHEKAYKANPQAYTQMLGRSF